MFGSWQRCFRRAQLAVERGGWVIVKGHNLQLKGGLDIVKGHNLQLKGGLGIVKGQDHLFLELALAQVLHNESILLQLSRLGCLLALHLNAPAMRPLVTLW